MLDWEVGGGGWIDVGEEAGEKVELGGREVGVGRGGGRDEGGGAAVAGAVGRGAWLGVG